MTKAEAIIARALASVRQAIQAGPQTTNSIAPVEELVRAENELINMLEDVRQGRSRPYKSSLGRMVTDTWPLQDELGSQICAAVHAHEKACCSGSK